MGRTKKALGVWLLTAVGLYATSASSKPIRATEDPVKNEPALAAEDKQHWAFQPLLLPQPPPVHNEQLARNPIDRFILASQEAVGEKLFPEAPPLTLLRRLTFDLTGLPPTAEQARAYLASHATNGDAAYESIVDELLRSDRYGEAWAQHWLDLARYADTDGFEHDLERKEAWKYRDWVIRALNADIPFDEFAAMQIAGDELPGSEAIATGFLLSGPDMPDTNFQDERMHLLLNGITSTVGSTFLGMTIGCAQCHDHPYDPLSQADFYRLRACFDNIPKLKRDKQLPPSYIEASVKPRESRVAIRGDHQRPGPVIPAGFPRIANPAEIDVYPTPAGNSSGRRAALARWITQPTNVLFLRTSVNRLWLHHFGRPLVGSPNDLGKQGEKPTHPQLLDWLAAELPREKWSLKRMHKMIVMSATYRQAPVMQHDSGGKAAELYVGFPRKRLTGEQLRDAMLLVSNRLNYKMGGPGVSLPLPAEVSTTLLKKQIAITQDEAEHNRRSIYVFARRNLRYPLFDVFDRPDALVSCGRRSESTTAPQALMLLNSSFTQTMANSLAAVIASTDSEPQRIIADATWSCYSRPPTDLELSIGTEFLQKQQMLTKTFQEAVSDYCLALLNASEFSWVD
ncbi:MAG: DUF1553 domain-containing protein [Verrucomicrobiaceae bacterium]|nr:DUF1553 domain-containing protein [Verrucomicrobiaceae bacterium]